MRTKRILTSLLMSLGLLAGTAYAASADLAGSAIGATEKQEDTRPATYRPEVGGEVVNGKGGGNGGGGNGGGGDTGCTAAASRIAYSLNTGSGYELFAVNPDGTCMTQLTTGDAARVVTGWTADDHILVRSATGTVRLLHVADSTDAATVSTVYSFNLPEAPTISAHHGASGLLPAAQQLLATSENSNIVVYAADGTARSELTSYTSTYTPGGSGSWYEISDPQWLPDTSDHSTARLAYRYVRADYVAGTLDAVEQGLRVLSIDAATWPAIDASDVTDKWVVGKDGLVGGEPASNYGYMDFSRDGAKVATWGPGGDGIYVIPVSYDDAADTVTLDTANAVHAATDISETYSDNGKTFSPDNSQLAYAASTLVGKGKTKTAVQSVFVIGSSDPSGSTEIDGHSNEAACCAVWGP